MPSMGQQINWNEKMPHFLFFVWRHFCCCLLGYCCYLWLFFFRPDLRSPFIFCCCCCSFPPLFRFVCCVKLCIIKWNSILVRPTFSISHLNLAMETIFFLFSFNNHFAPFDDEFTQNSRKRTWAATWFQTVRKVVLVFLFLFFFFLRNVESHWISQC